MEVDILDSSRTVALLIDYDNLQLGAQRDAPGTELDLRAIVTFAQRYGTLLVARAYAEWNNPTERLETYKAGIEPVYAPILRSTGPSGPEGKSLADPVMVADGIDLLWTHRPSVFVLVTSDKDMIPLARLAKQRGAKVVVVGSDFTAVLLREMADEVFSYRQVVQEVTGVLVGGPPARRQGRPQPALRERPAPAPAVAAPSPAPAPQPPVEERAAVSATVLPIEPLAEERPQQPSGRRRRRRGGRGRGRGAAAGPQDTAQLVEANVAGESAGVDGVERVESPLGAPLTPAAEPETPAPVAFGPESDPAPSPAVDRQDTADRQDTPGAQVAGGEAEVSTRPAQRRRRRGASATERREA